MTTSVANHLGLEEKANVAAEISSRQLVKLTALCEKNKVRLSSIVVEKIHALTEKDKVKIDKLNRTSPMFWSNIFRIASHYEKPGAGSVVFHCVRSLGGRVQYTGKGTQVGMLQFSRSGPFPEMIVHDGVIFHFGNKVGEVCRRSLQGDIFDVFDKTRVNFHNENNVHELPPGFKVVSLYYYRPYGDERPEWRLAGGSTAYQLTGMLNPNASSDKMIQLESSRHNNWDLLLNQIDTKDLDRHYSYQFVVPANGRMPLVDAPQQIYYVGAIYNSTGRLVVCASPFEGEIDHISSYSAPPSDAKAFLVHGLIVFNEAYKSLYHCLSNPAGLKFDASQVLVGGDKLGCGSPRSQVAAWTTSPTAYMIMRLLGANFTELIHESFRELVSVEDLLGKPINVAVEMITNAFLQREFARP